MCTDLTGAFPVQSRRGNKYVMVLCEVDNDIIITEPLKNRTAEEMVKAFKKLMKRLNRNCFLVYIVSTFIFQPT